MSFFSKREGENIHILVLTINKQMSLRPHKRGNWKNQGLKIYSLNSIQSKYVDRYSRPNLHFDAYFIIVLHFYRSEY